MRIIIEGREYEASDSLTKPRLNDLMAIRKATGMDAKEVMASLKQIGADDLMSSDSLMALGILVWLTRRRAGEVLTLEQACDFSLDDLQIITDAAPEVAAEPVPTLPGSYPATGAASEDPRRRSRSAGRTSKKASTRA